MPRQKYYFIYKTTCVVTQKFYIGMHVTQRLDDGYLGSGTLLRRSIEKYGRESHVREILEYCDDTATLVAREAAIVSEEVILDSSCMNLRIGGRGGFSAEQQRRNGVRGNASMKIMYEKYPDLLEQKRLKVRDANLARYAAGAPLQGCFGPKQSEMVERARSPEAREKRKQSFKKSNHSQGSKNSQYGTKWVTRDGLSIKVKLHELDDALASGWILGRVLKKKPTDTGNP